MRIADAMRPGVAAIAAGAVLVSGCTGGHPGHRLARAPASSTTVPETTTTSAGATPSTASPGSTAPVPASARDTAPKVSGERQGSAVLVSVATEDHGGQIRYVFTFRDLDPDGRPAGQPARPPWDVRYVTQRDAVKEGSGQPVASAGSAAHLRIRFEASMHDADGHSTLQRPVADDRLAFAGDFEGRVTWFYGARRQGPFAVSYLGGGRVAVEIAA